MGAAGLYKVLSPYMVYMPISALIGTVVGMDASFLIHVLLARHASAILLTQDWESFDSDVRDTVRYLKSKGLKMRFVFDGRRVSAKLTNEKRAERRAAALLELQLESDILRELWDQLKLTTKELLSAVDGDDEESVADRVDQQKSQADEYVRSLGNRRKRAVAAIGSQAVHAAERMRIICHEEDCEFEVGNSRRWGCEFGHIRNRK